MEKGVSKMIDVRVRALYSLMLKAEAHSYLPTTDAEVFYYLHILASSIEDHDVRQKLIQKVVEDLMGNGQDQD